jgi:hypothetical protein
MPRRRLRRSLSLVQSDLTVRALTPDSQRVLAAAARDVARALGREAAREAFAKMREKRKVS